MGKFDGLLLVSDFDDTLYDSHHRIPPRNLEALGRWIDQGGRFTVATGRAHRTFAPYVHLAPINAPVVLSNGSAIYDFQTETMLVQTLLDDRAPADFQALMEAMPSLGLETYHGEDIYVYRPNAITDAHMRKVGTDYEVRDIPDMPAPWTKAIVQQEYDVLLRAREWLEEHCPGRYEAVFSNRFYLEITHRGCNKGGDGGPATGDAPYSQGKPLLRGGQPERHPHDGLVRHPLCPGQLRPGGEGLGGDHPVPL